MQRSQPSSVQSSMSEQDVTEEDTRSGSVGPQSLDTLDPRKPRCTPQSYCETLIQSDPPDRFLKHRFNQMLPLIAAILNKHIEDLKPTLRSHQKSDQKPYNRLEIDDIDKAKDVMEIFNKIQIEDCWLNTDVLVRLINIVPKKKAWKRAQRLLEAYHRRLKCFTCHIFLKYTPSQYLQSLTWDDESDVEPPHLSATFDKEFESFSIADFLKEQQFLSRIFKIPLQNFQYLDSRSASTLIIWALSIPNRKAYDILKQAERNFWQLKEHSIIKLEVEGMFQLYLRGKHLPYLIERALLQQNQDFIGRTEVSSTFKNVCTWCINSAWSQTLLFLLH